MNVNSAYLSLLGSSSQTALSPLSLLTGDASAQNVTLAAFSGAFEQNSGQNILQSEALQTLSDFISENIEGPVAEALQKDVSALNKLQEALSPGNQAVFSLLASGNAESGALINLLV